MPSIAQESPARAGSRDPRTLISSALLWLPLALFIGIVGFELFGLVPIGLADNGDFVRILGPLRLRPAAPAPHFKYFVNDYVTNGPLYDPGVPSSEGIIASSAKQIARIILPAGTFHLGVMGFLHAAFLTLALFLFLNAIRHRAPWLRLVCGLLLVFIWADLEYVQQLNTAYTDAGAIVALAAVSSLAAQSLLTAGAWPRALSFAFFGCFLLATKTQHETALPFLVAFCLLAAFRASKYHRTAWLAASGVLLATAGWMIANTPPDYRAPPAFSVVFYKLAVLSPDPKAVLQDFHMPEKEFGKYVGHYAYESGVPIGDPAFRRRIINLVTPASLGLFYWRHPQILAKVLLFDLHHSAPDVNLSRAGYGHLREADIWRGKRPFELTAWGNLRHRLFSVAPFYPAWLLGIVIILAGICMLNPRIGNRFPVWPLALFSALLAVTSFLFASLTDAIDTTRHLVFFQAATDLTIFSVALSLCLTIETRPARFRRVTQFWWLAPVIFLLWLCYDSFRLDTPSSGKSGTFDDSSREIAYFGPWTPASFPQAAGETFTYSNDRGSNARLSFTGTEITWIYTRAPNRGIGSVKIDGVPRGEFDLYSAAIVWQSGTAFRDLTPGNHTFEVTVTGHKDAAATDQYVDIDALIAH